MSKLLDEIDAEAYHDNVGHGIIAFEYVRAIIGNLETKLAEANEYRDKAIKDRLRLERINAELEAQQQWRPIRCSFDEQDYKNDIPDFTKDPVLYKIPKRFSDSYVYADSVDDEGNLYHDTEFVGTIFEAIEYLPLPLPAPPTCNTQHKH